MSIRWKMTEKVTGLASIAAGPRSHYLKNNDEDVMLVYAIGGNWSKNFEGYRFKVLFGPNKFKNSKTLFPDYQSAKIAAKNYYLKNNACT